MLTLCNMRNIICIVRNSTIDYILPKTRQKILSLMLLNPDKWWYMTEIANSLNLSISSLQRELFSLVKADILQSRKDGNRIYYKSQRLNPIFEELQSIMIKTVAIVDVIKKRLNKFKKNIHVMFIYGSIARSEEKADSDIDLMIIGDMKLANMISSLRVLEKELSRPLNPTIFTKIKFKKMYKIQDGFISTVMADKKIFVIGNKDELESLVE